MPTSSGIFAVCFAAFGSAMVLIRHHVWVGERAWVRKYHPNMMVVALAMGMFPLFVFIPHLDFSSIFSPSSIHLLTNSADTVIPQTVYSAATLVGAIFAYVWGRKSARTFDIYGYAVAAGLIAGEGIGGVVNAIFQVAGISGDKYGTNVACPLNSC